MIKFYFHKLSKGLILTVFLIIGYDSPLFSKISPIHCFNTSFQFQNSFVFLNVKKTDLNQSHAYYLYNKSPYFLNINHISNQSMSAGWGSSLLPYHVSIILIRTPFFNLFCGNYTCKEVLNICELNPIYYSFPFNGQYWLIENKGINDWLKELKKRTFTINKSNEINHEK